MAELSIEARMPTEEAIRVVLGSWYPDMPPKLVGESPAEYTDRLTGADRMGWEPYDHKRNRQCAIGWHDECSDPAGVKCQCPCHREAPGDAVEVMVASPEVRAFVAALLDEWAGDQYQIDQEWGSGKGDVAAEVAERRAEWVALVADDG